MWQLRHVCAAVLVLCAVLGGRAARCVQHKSEVDVCQNEGSKGQRRADTHVQQHVATQRVSSCPSHSAHRPMALLCVAIIMLLTHAITSVHQKTVRGAAKAGNPALA
jgi:hypothetical protein